MIFDLPKEIEFGGRSWPIQTDYRVILTVLSAFEDSNLNDSERAYVCLYNLYDDFEDIPKELMQEAFEKAMEFIDGGKDRTNKPSKKTIDWTQDAPLIFPAVNSVAGREVRSVDYIHWWTFLGYFMEIKDSTFATILSLRQKKARGKKLEKYEQEFWKNNKDICEIRNRLTDEEKAEKERIKALLG